MRALLVVLLGAVPKLVSSIQQQQAPAPYVTPKAPPAVAAKPKPKQIGPPVRYPPAMTTTVRWVPAAPKQPPLPPPTTTVRWPPPRPAQDKGTSGKQFAPPVPVLEETLWETKRPFRWVRMHFDAFVGPAVVKHYTDAQWYYDYKIWVGLVFYFLVLNYWLIYGYTGNYQRKAVYAIALNLIMLHVVQYHGDRFLLITMSGLCFNNFVFVFYRWVPADVMKAGGFKCTSLYQDVAGPPVQALFCFIGQLGLILFYMEAIISRVRGSPGGFQVSPLFWVIAYFGMQMTAYFARGEDSALGEPWPIAEWLDVARNADDCLFQEVRESEDDTMMAMPTMAASSYGPHLPFKVDKWNLYMRLIMGFIVNNMFRDVLAFTIPILLAQFNDPLNFVVYCVGCNFLCTLDDMHTKTIRMFPDPGARDTHRMPARSMASGSPPRSPRVDRAIADRHERDSRSNSPRDL